MATVKVTSTLGVDMGDFALPDYGTGTIATHTPTKWHIDYPGGASDDYTGTGLKYDGSNHLTGGTITGFTIVESTGEQFAVTGISVPASHLTNATTFLAEALAGNDTVTGGNGDDHLLGGAGNDTLDGGKGADKMDGGDGNDTYIVDNAGDQAADSSGIDTAKISLATIANATNFATVENFTFTGKGDWAFTGNALDNIITGGAGNDALNGNGGKDTLNGGAGNDTYKIDSADDTVIDSAGTSDTIVASFLIDKARAGIENYAYTGSSAWAFTGTDVNNILVGGSGSDTLDGGKGNDTLNAGTAGTDSLKGGLGNDTYVIDHAGVTIIEAAKGGTDTIQASVSIDLLNGAGLTGQEIENVTLTGSGKIDATGNGLDNVLTGNNGDNKLDGGAGNDTLNGGTAGADSLTGGLGNDTYVIDHTGVTIIEAAKGGTDTIQASVTIDLTGTGFKDQEIENVTLTGSGKIDATGNDLDNVLTGNSGNNNLDGGAGNDTMTGGAGNDTYTIDSAGDKAIELATATGGSHDTILTSILLKTAFANVEDYTYTGAAADWTFTGNASANFITAGDGNDTLDGGAGNDAIVGGKGNDTIAGGAGDDQIDAGLGNDHMNGGAGNDRYWIDSLDDHVTDSAGTADRVTSSVLLTDPIAGIEQYFYTGAAKWTFNGTDANNWLVGGTGDDVLNGGKGNDLLTGGTKGVNDLTGGLGNDDYVIQSATDRIHEDAKGGTDLVETVLASTDLTKDAIYAGQEIENLLLLDGAVTAIGNIFNNIIQGNKADNEISGGDGNDILVGEAGDDTLSGDKGNDTLVGGDGNDIYVIDAAGDKVIEGATKDAGSHDLIESSILLKALVANVEDYTYTGDAAWTFTGSAVANELTGSTKNDILNGAAGNDTLVGNGGDDTLNGGVGNDDMTGSAGNDIYDVDSAGDAVHEGSGAGSGIDTIKTSVAITQVTNVENYIFTGKGDWTFTGNTLDNQITGGAGNDTLNGGDGNDVLDGGKGNDDLTGGKGDDTYVVDGLGDKVHETSGQGIDTVKIAVAITDTTNYANVENFIFTGKANWTFTANGADNTIQGGAGNDKLDGGTGDDTAVFAGKRTDYQVNVGLDGTVTVKDMNGVTNGADGTDTLSHFEHLKFSDGTIDLQDTVLLSARSQAFAGVVASIGDVNGDGLADFVVGAQSDDGKASGTGAAYIVFGNAAGLPESIDLAALGSAGVKLSGPDIGGGTGVSVHSAGDVNGDGIDDVIVGATGEHSGAGAAFVVFGSTSLASDIDLGALNGTNGFALNGVSASTPAGAAVAAGDINGDGFSDLIVSALNVYPPTAGTTYVVFGHGGAFTSTIDLSTLNGTNGTSFNGRLVDLSGNSVASAGDVNGDGIDDLFIGAPIGSGAGFAGEVYVVFGQTGGFTAPISLASLDGKNGFELKGISKYDLTGYSVSAAGDINGDGFDDIVVGAAGARGHGLYTGSAFVIFGHDEPFNQSVSLSSLNGTNGFKIAGLAKYDYTGQSVSIVGDVNGDGYDDIVIGAPGDPYSNNSGAAYLIFGHAGSFTASLDVTKLSLGQGIEFHDLDSSHNAAASVSGAGDVNGDGYDDLLIGIPGADTAGAGEVATVLVYGGNFNLASTSLIEGTSGNDTKNGTTAAEIIIGAQGNDTLNGGGGHDVIQGGSGNDTITVTDKTFNHVDGGGGFDTLSLDYGGTIDFANLDGNAATSDRGKISSIEVIDVANSQANDMTLHLADVIDIAPQNQNFSGKAALDNILVIDGDNTDTLTLSTADGWTKDTITLTGVYDIYTSHGVKIAVDTDISVTVS